MGAEPALGKGKVCNSPYGEHCCLLPWTISSLKQPILNRSPQGGVDWDCLGQELLTKHSWNLT